MASSVKPQIPLKTISDTAQEFRFTLSETFFKEADVEDMLGGEMEVVAIATKGNNGLTYDIRFSVQGTICVPCDRCLDELSLSVNVHEVLKLIVGLSEETEDDTVRFIGEKTTDYDLSGDILQAITLSLPLQRVHPEGMCNPEMLRCLGIHSARHTDFPN